jgi:hypothetical protein
MNEQTEAERQAAAQKAAADKQTAGADDRFNRMLRGGPSKEQVEAQARLKDKTRKRLEKLAVDESEDDETRQWAQNVLDGKVDLNGDPITPKSGRPRSADGGEGRNSPVHERDPGAAFNDMIREARYPGMVNPWWLPS